MSESDEFVGRDEKLKNLRERENAIKQEREKLLASRPWYSRPQNIIALMAIVIPILTSIIFKIYDEDKKQISVTYNESNQLLTNSTKFERKVFVQYDSLRIENISSVIVRISNSGDIPIKKSDFLDGPIRFELVQEKRPQTPNQYSPILEIVKLKDANQQHSVLSILDNEVKGVFTYIPSLLNPGDEVELNVLVPNESNIDFEIFGKVENGAVIINKQENSAEPNFQTNKYSKTLLSLFKNRALSIPLTILVFFILIIFNLVLWAMNRDGDFESDPKFVGVLLLLGFSTFSVFTLALFITLIL